jgi:hypothetical protein
MQPDVRRDGTAGKRISALSRRAGAVLMPLLLLGATGCDGVGLRFGLPVAGGLLPVQISLPGGTDPGEVTVALDGVDVTASFAPGGPGLVGSLAIPPPGGHQIHVTRQTEPLPGLVLPETTGFVFQSPEPAPAVVAPVQPAPGATAPRSAWIRFQLASPAPPEALAGFAFGVECNGVTVARHVHALGDGSVIVNPYPELPAGASCRVAWRGDAGALDTSFTVASNAAGAPGVASYNRPDPFALAPFPDDYWTEPDASKPSGLAVVLPPPPFTDLLQVQAFNALTGLLGEGDGFSRQTPIVLAFSHPVDPSAIPTDEFASQHPFAPVQLVDVDPASPDFGERIPYRMLLRTDTAGGRTDHVAILFPTIDLRERGRYAIVVTKRVFASAQLGRPFGTSPFFASVVGPPVAGEPAAVTRARDRLAGALGVVTTLAEVPIPVEDVALALSFSIRSHPPVADLVHLKELALASPPPELILPDIASNPCPVPPTPPTDPKTFFCVRTTANRAIEAYGRVRLPNFRSVTLSFQRDPVTGLPVQTGTHEVPFVMTLPVQALAGPVHPLMYQHGNPGSPRELLSEFANGHLDDAGFALLGIQDTLNREISEDVAVQVPFIFFVLVQTSRIADYWNQTGSDMIFFLRLIQSLGGLDLMRAGPGGVPQVGSDGVPEIDPSVILYKGISEGANNAQRFLPFAPEILAAEATVGGARLGETLIHQSAGEILAQIGGLLPQLKPNELWVGLSLFQAGFDPQDGHTFLRHLYGDPLLPFVGSADTTPPSTIWTEGFNDSLVPNNATRAMVHALGIPHVRPVVRALPTVEQVDPPLAENVATGITAGYFQVDPFQTPSCVARGQLEGHYCPQTASEMQDQRLHFLETAIQGSPEIVDPY